MTTHNLVTLDNTQATRLTPLGKHSGMDITLQNVNASGYIYVGGEGVWSGSYGFRIMPNHSISFELPGEDSLYAIGSVDNLVVAVLTTNLEAQQG